ncbi:NTP transferase domain-containing protein [Bradymonas sediminis]|nr:NTP transferase domain-containing protein [Bradymonas sediminis]
MPTSHAVILAAGFGSRLQADEGHKLLVKIGGRTMLSRHLENFHRLGVSHVTVVTGYENEVLARAIAEGEKRESITVRCAHNPDFKTSNGISVLAGVDDALANIGEAAVPFWLTMSDHLFDPAMFLKLRETFAPAYGDRSDGVQGMLVVDQKLDSIFDMPDANKLAFDKAALARGVAPQDAPLGAIGKDLPEFELVDAGLFWCGAGFAQALRAERDARGDCCTSDAVRRLDARGAMAFWDLGEHLWQDVDTPEARGHAEVIAGEWR